MAAKSIRDILESTKILSIVFCFLIMSTITYVMYIVAIGTNPNGETCTYINWIRSQPYQMIWNHKLCVFSTEYYITFYSQFIPLFLMYDYIRRKIMGFNPGINWRMLEVGIWFILNWGYLLWLTSTNYGNLDWMMTCTSFMGTLLFFVPIVLLAVITHYVSNKIILGLFGSILFMYFLLLVYLITTQ